MTQAKSAAILGCAGPQLGPEEAAFFAQVQPAGFILFARNIESPDQVYRLTHELRAAVGWQAPVAIDQEGGRVQRMGPPHWRQWRPALDEVTRLDPDSAARAMDLRMQIIAAELRAVGLDMNCAPLADLATDATHPVLRNRCYGTSARGVAAIARAVANGLLSGGVLPVLKHMPGHGRATVDSHLEPPFVATPRRELEGTDFAAFRALSDLPVGMTGHMVFDDIDPGMPSTSSSVVINLVRYDIGFDGLLMSDDLSMEALNGDVGQRARGAVEAGCDLALHCNGKLPEMEAVVAGAGALTPKAHLRLERALILRTAPDHVDIPALEAEFVTLTE